MSFEHYTNLKWDKNKGQYLIRARGVSFEDIVRSKYLLTMQHPYRDNQKMMLFLHNDYVWVIPCEVEKDYVFLKTAFPSRNYTNAYKRGELR